MGTSAVRWAVIALYGAIMPGCMATTVWEGGGSTGRVRSIEFRVDEIYRRPAGDQADSDKVGILLVAAPSPHAPEADGEVDHAVPRFIEAHVSASAADRLAAIVAAAREAGLRATGEGSLEEVGADEHGARHWLRVRLDDVVSASAPDSLLSDVWLEGDARARSEADMTGWMPVASFDDSAITIVIPVDTPGDDAGDIATKVVLTPPAVAVDIFGAILEGIFDGIFGSDNEEDDEDCDDRHRHHRDDEKREESKPKIGIYDQG